MSDVNKPKQVAQYHIGKSGTDSEALRDHKAFLFDKDKNILVIPITEVKTEPTYDPRLGYYRQNSWQGAYVFSLDPTNGFVVKGQIKHYEGEEQGDWYYQGSNQIRRSLYMDDVLYTISSSRIKANDLTDLSKELKTLDLPTEVYIPQPMPYIDSDVRITSGGKGVATPTSVGAGVAGSAPKVAEDMPMADTMPSK